MTPEPTPLVTVTQADRLAAAHLFRRYNGSGSSIEGAILSGAYDHDERVQIVSRHRLAALEAAVNKVRAIRDARWPSAGYDRACDDIEAAIRALSNKGGRDGE